MFQKELTTYLYILEFLLFFIILVSFFFFLFFFFCIKRVNHYNPLPWSWKNRRMSHFLLIKLIYKKNDASGRALNDFSKYFLNLKRRKRNVLAPKKRDAFGHYEHYYIWVFIILLCYFSPPLSLFPCYILHHHRMFVSRIVYIIKHTGKK